MRSRFRTSAHRGSLDTAGRDPPALTQGNEDARDIGLRDQHLTGLGALVTGDDPAPLHMSITRPARV